MGEQARFDLELRRNEELLGTLKDRYFDWPWTICDFKPKPTFEQYRSIFDEVWTALHAEDDTAHWSDLYDKVESLGLSLVYHDGIRITDFMIQIHDNTAEYKVYKYPEKLIADG
jgi:hypothetical protein